MSCKRKQWKRRATLWRVMGGYAQGVGVRTFSVCISKVVTKKKKSSFQEISSELFTDFTGLEVSEVYVKLEVFELGLSKLIFNIGKYPGIIISMFQQFKLE